MDDKNSEFQNFSLEQAWDRRIEICSPVLKGAMNQAYFFQILLKKRHEIKSIEIDQERGRAVIDFDAGLLSKSDLLKIVDTILGNLKQRQRIESDTIPTEIQSETISEICLLVDGMSCSACAALIKVALKKMPGVQDACAELETKEVVVYGSVSETDLIKKIEDLGYKIIRNK